MSHRVIQAGEIAGGAAKDKEESLQRVCAPGGYKSHRSRGEVMRDCSSGSRLSWSHGGEWAVGAD